MEVGSSSLPGTTLRRKAMCTRHVKLPGTTSDSPGRENGGLAQLARAPALQAGGQRFESVILHYPETGIVMVSVIIITNYSLLITH